MAATRAFPACSVSLRVERSQEYHYRVVARNSFAVLAALILLSSNLGAAVCNFSCAVGGGGKIHHHAPVMPRHGEIQTGHEHHHCAAGVPCNQGGQDLQLTRAVCERCCDDPQAVFQKPAVALATQLQMTAAGTPAETLPLQLSANLLRRQSHIKAPPVEHARIVPAPLSLRI